MVAGSVIARQLEQEFTNILGANVRRWAVKKVDETIYTMRFPNAQLIKDWSHFNLIMKTTPAQISISPWSPAVGAKVELQTAWFRVRGIPSDKRSIKTLAYVGSLMGATVEIDDKSLSGYEFVRIKIACRDVTKVPQFVEGAIVPYLCDFEYEREVVMPTQPPRETIQVHISGSNTNPTPKKPGLTMNESSDS